MYGNNIEPEMFLPPGSESFNHNATRTTSSRSRSNNVNNNIVPVYNWIQLSTLINLKITKGVRFGKSTTWPIIKYELTKVKSTS